MNYDLRAKVAWSGSNDTAEFKAQLDSLASFELVPVENEQKLELELTTARAAVFEYGGDTPLYIARIRRIKELAMENGVLIVLVNGSGVDSEAFQVVANRIFADTPGPYGPESATFRPIREFQRNFCWASHEISVWRPGPPTSFSLKIHGDYDPKHEKLLRRGFSDFVSIEVNHIQGGKSGANVYLVTPSEQHRTPFIAKVDDTERIAAEADSYTKFVGETIGFNHRPNLDRARTIYTPRLSMLVEDFVERAKPVYEILRNSNPAVIVSSIFEGALRNWRRDTSSRKVSLSREVVHLEKILKLRAPVFFEAAGIARKTLNSPFDGEELLSACNSIEDQYCNWSRIHGDLHAGNVYVGMGGSDVILIDFYKTGEGPCMLDLACLEVDIAFNREKLSHSLAMELYKSPLQLPSFQTSIGAGRLWLLDTLRAIRRFALTDLDHRAYAFALACYLIRYASFEDCGSAESRAIATCVASDLIKNFPHEKTN